jgi:hypothetical protein
MMDKAFQVLDAIRRDDAADLAGLDEWIGAFRTICWAVDTDAGVRLTQAGRQAYDEMAGELTVRRARRA